MTLKELKQRCEKSGFKYAYGKFKKATEPPHLVAITVGTDNFKADNRVYFKKTPIQLDYTYINKNENEQYRIEEEILCDIVWRKTDEIYLQDEEIWQVSYYFEI